MGNKKAIYLRSNTAVTNTGRCIWFRFDKIDFELFRLAEHVKITLPSRPSNTTTTTILFNQYFTLGRVLNKMNFCEFLEHDFYRGNSSKSRDVFNDVILQHVIIPNWYIAQTFCKRYLNISLQTNRVEIVDGLQRATVWKNGDISYLYHSISDWHGSSIKVDSNLPNTSCSVK